MDRPETLYLIDGYAAIFRAYFAIRRPLYSPVTGEETQAVFVFAQMLLKLYTKLGPDYIAVALDAPGRTFRDDLYEQYEQHRVAAAGKEAPTPVAEGEAVPVPVEGMPEEAPPTARYQAYKGTRNETPDSLSQQIPRILELLELLGIPIIGKPGLEADDIIATLTDRVLADPAHPDLRVRIVTKDKDMEQLLSERVTIYDIHNEAEMDVAALFQKKGVTPAQVIDLLALTGDTVDNIPGVAGIGPKTAAKLIQKFGSLEEILANMDQVTGWWRDNLEKARPVLPISRRLVTLERDPDIPFSLEAARPRRPDPEAIARFFDVIGFHRIKNEFLELCES